MSGKAQQRLDILLGVLCFLSMSFALYMALLGAPTEVTMGHLQRIFYFHVPAAIIGLVAFGLNFFSSILYILRKNHWWDSLALASSEIGILFFSMVLVTGPIWARPVWFFGGRWWTWTPRLTLSFILCLLYAAYLLIRKGFEDPERRAMVSAVFGIVAFVDVPLVWFSIRWWRDIHPSPMLETGGLAPSMRPAFYVCIAAFMILFLYLLRRRFYLEMIRNKVEWMMRRIDEV